MTSLFLRALNIKIRPNIFSLLGAQPVRTVIDVNGIEYKHIPYKKKNDRYHPKLIPDVDAQLELDPSGKVYHGFVYYPRDPDHKDPPYEPTKLFRVVRTRTLHKLPRWEKEILEFELGITSRRTVAIVKNSEENNAMLYKVKHLVDIKPITFPYGFPADGDLSKGFLRENGEFVSQHRLSGVDNLEKSIEAVKKTQDNFMNSSILRRRLWKKWISRWSD